MQDNPFLLSTDLILSVWLHQNITWLLGQIQVTGTINHPNEPYCITSFQLAVTICFSIWVKETDTKTYNTCCCTCRCTQTSITVIFRFSERSYLPLPYLFPSHLFAPLPCHSSTSLPRHSSTSLPLAILVFSPHLLLILVFLTPPCRFLLPSHLSINTQGQWTVDRMEYKSKKLFIDLCYRLRTGYLLPSTLSVCSQCAQASKGSW